MSEFTVSGPDGKRYRVNAPQGASQHDVLEYVKKNAGSLKESRTSPPPAAAADAPKDQSGIEALVNPPPAAPGASGAEALAGGPNPGAGKRLEAIGTGMKDPLVTAEQFLERMLPSRHMPGGGIDKVAKEREETIKKEGLDTGYRTLGNVLSPVNYLPIGVIGTASTAARIGSAAASGALSSVLNRPIEPDHFWEETLKRAAEGGALGGALGAGSETVSKLITPKFRDSVNLLLRDGVKLTPGQLIKFLKRPEELSKSMPIMQLVVPGAEQRALQDYNRAAINSYALGPIGKTLPEDIAMGPDAIRAAGDEIGTVYDDIHSRITLRGTPQMAQDLHALGARIKQQPEAIEKEFGRVYENIVAPRLKKSGGITGPQLQDMRSELRTYSRILKASEHADQRQAGYLIDELNLTIGNHVAQQNPAEAAGLKAADEAYAGLVRLEEASANRVKSLGIFTPADLLSATKRAAGGVRNKTFARGDALLQDYARAGEDVMGNIVPDSGTAGRQSWKATGAALAGVAGAAPLGHEAQVGAEAILGAGAVGSVPYTKPGMAVLNQWARPGARRTALSGASEHIGPALAPAATMELLGDGQK